MPSPKLEAAAASTRSEAEVRAKSEVKYCVNCTHCIQNEDHRFLRCALTAATSTYRFNAPGLDTTMYDYCSGARTVGQPCGPEGKLFEPAPAAICGGGE